MGVPDFFTLEDKRILMFSPQGMAAEGFNNRNLFQSGYLLGEWQPGQPFVRKSEFIELDHGHDFYAPQSFLTPDGRRIVIGWLDMWESPLPEQQDGWAGMLSSARTEPRRRQPSANAPGQRGRGPAWRVVPMASEYVEKSADHDGGKL